MPKSLLKLRSVFGRKELWLLLALVVLSVAMANNNNNDLNSLTSTASVLMCGVLRFLLGPVAWGLVFGAFAVGVGALAVGGRGALRMVIMAMVAALVLVIGIGWARTQAQGGTNTYGNVCGIVN